MNGEGQAAHYRGMLRHGNAAFLTRVMISLSSEWDSDWDQAIRAWRLYGTFPLTDATP
jgi:hypothetical protein